MPSDYPIYDGAAPVLTGAAVTMPRDVMEEERARGLANVAKAIGGLVQSARALDDQEAALNDQSHLMRVRQANALEVDRRLQLPDGDEDSFFEEDGTVRLSAIGDYAAEQEKLLAGVGQRIHDPERAAEMKARAAQMGEEMVADLGELVQRHGFQRREQAWKDAYDLAVETENTEDVMALIARGVSMGLYSAKRGEVMKLRYASELERKRIAAVKKAGKGRDGRELQYDMLTSLRQAPVQADVPNLTSSAPANDGSDGGALTLAGESEPEMRKGKPLTMPGEDAPSEPAMAFDGLAALPPDEFCSAFADAAHVADRAEVAVHPGTGQLEFSMGPAASESTQMLAGVAAAFGDYTLDDYRRTISKIAAGYFSDERMAGMSGGSLIDKLYNEVKMDGAADVWFDGDELAYEGFVKTELSRLLAARGSDAVDKADRMLVGADGADGIVAMLEREVTDEEISGLTSYGYEAMAQIAKNGIRDEESRVLHPYFRSALREYETHHGRWVEELAKDGKNKYKPSDEEDVAKRFKDDWQEFSTWYMKQKDLYGVQHNALVKGVRDVYRQRAVNAVATLRGTGSYQIGNEVVQLDGKSDWAQEQKVLRHVLRQPLSERELGSVRALADTKVQLAQERKRRAALYAQEAKEHRAHLQTRQDEIAAAKARKKKADEEEKKSAALREKVREEEYKEKQKAAQKRLDGYSKKTNYRMRWDGKTCDAGTPPVVTIPRDMYEEVAGALGTNDGFYARLGSLTDDFDVRPGDVDGVMLNLPALNLLDGKKDKFTARKLSDVVNGGLMIPARFTAVQGF